MVTLPQKLTILIPPELLEAMEFDKSYFSIPLYDNGEGLVNVEKIIERKRLKAQFNHELTVTNRKRLFYLRETVATQLVQAVVSLNKRGFIPRFEYLYRRIEDQHEHFKRRVRKILDLYPHLGKKTIIQLAGVFTAANPNTAAHVSGAAIDLNLLDLNEKPVDMGCVYNHTGPESKTDFKKISKEAKKNRKILYTTMTKSGFVNYPYEYWHYSLGDKIAARVLGNKTAFYGPVVFNPDNNSTKTVKNDNKIFDTSEVFQNQS